MIRSVILDFDGVIADSEVIWHSVLSDLYALRDAVLSEELWRRSVGATLEHFDPFAELARLTGRPQDRDAIEAEGESRFRGLMQRTKPLPGVVNFIRQASVRGIHCAVASSSRRDSVVPYLQQYGLLNQFHHVVTREAVARAKPAPDLYVEALARLGHHPEEAIAIEDSLPGLTAATAAGLRCVIVPSPATQGQDFLGAECVVPTLRGISLDLY